MVEFRIVPWGLRFQVESRYPGDYTGSDEWRTVDTRFGKFLTFGTEADAENYIDGLLEELEAKRKREEEVEKFAKDHPPRIYP